MAILSIQSRVTSGYVGNAAAVPILQRLGRTVWPIDTVALSNHPAHGSHSGGARPAAEIETLVHGLRKQHLLARCDAVLSGYLGTAETGPVVLAAASQVREDNPDALWCCDPVMGDHGEFYVVEGIPEFFRDAALPAADLILPNAFEASYLSGVSIGSAGDAAKAAGILLEAGPRTVVISGIAQGNGLGALVATVDGCWQCMAPALDAPAYGAGDAFAALFANYYLAPANAPEALSRAVDGVHQILQATAAANTADLALVPALPCLDNLAGLPVDRIA